jgi:signal transduction histidine kinase
VRQRDEFLAMLAHELRNPLAPLWNSVHLLGTLPISDPLFVKCRTMIDKQARTSRAWWTTCSMPRASSSARSSCARSAWT